MTSLLAPTSFDNKETGIPSSNRNFTQRSLNSTPYRFPYRFSFPLPFFFTPATSSMGSLLSPSQECHPFTPSSLAHDLVVRTHSAQRLRRCLERLGGYPEWPLDLC